MGWSNVISNIMEYVVNSAKMGEPACHREHEQSLSRPKTNTLKPQNLNIFEPSSRVSCVHFVLLGAYSAGTGKKDSGWLA